MDHNGFVNAAAALGVKENVPPYLKKDLTLDDLKTGVSFASAGSGYDNATCRTMVRRRTYAFTTHDNVHELAMHAWS